MNTDAITAALRSSLPALASAAGIPVDFAFPPSTHGVKVTARFGADVPVSAIPAARRRIEDALKALFFVAVERPACAGAKAHTSWYVSAWHGEMAA